MSETVAIKEHDRLFDLYDADGCLVGKANPGKKVMLADAFYVPERTCRMIDNGCELCCSECDERHGYDDEPNYCHSCGAKVLGD